MQEMESAKKSLRQRGCRTIAEFNSSGGRMPYRVVVLDEFADLMMAADKQPVAALDYGKPKDNLEWALATARLTS